MEIKFFLKEKGVPETLLFARVNLKNSPPISFKYYLSEKISPKDWNQSKQIAQPLNRYAEFNDLLKTRRQQMKDVYREFVNTNKTEPTPNELKQAFNAIIRPDRKEREPEPTNLVLPFFGQFIEVCKTGARTNSKGNPITKGTITTYANTYNVIAEYQHTKKRPFRFEDIDLDWYNGFVAYLTTEKRHSVNFIGKHIKCLKTVLNDAAERGLHETYNYRKKSFKKLNENATTVYLDENELENLVKLNLSKYPRLDRVRDLFLIGCYTGLRFADWDKVSAKDIDEDFIQVTPDKTQEPVVIPVHEQVKTILNKYGGVLPKKPSNQKTNDYLKEIGKMLETMDNKTVKRITKGGLTMTANVEKWQMLSTHVARRSFATNQYKAGIPTLTIMAITGHKTEKDFLRYIRATPKEHAQLMKLQWQSKKDKKTIAL